MTATASGVTWTMYPVGVTLPDKTALTRVKAYATPEGLFLYRAVPARVGPDGPEVHGDEPDWFSPINYALTRRPPAQYSMRNGWDVYTDAGLVVVTAEGGCGCGWPLRRWAPSFARKRLRWPASV